MVCAITIGDTNMLLKHAAIITAFIFTLGAGSVYAGSMQKTTSKTHYTAPHKYKHHLKHHFKKACKDGHCKVWHKHSRYAPHHKK